MDLHIHWDVVLILVLLEGAYLLAVGPLRGRIVHAALVRPTRQQVALFSAGVFTIFLAEGTPIHDFSEQYLFSVHMWQHILLITFAVPLMLLGTPSWLARPVLDHPLLGWIMRTCTRPLIAMVLFNGTLAVWHLPQIYDWALWNHNAHILEHVTFFATAVFLWWPIFSPLPELPRLNYPLQILYLFVQSLLPGVIAALITFSDRVIYPTYQAAPRVTALSALEDQQIAGLIMKLAGTLAMWVLATIIFFIWANREDQAQAAAAPPAEKG
jgi:putative membrane protein